MREDGKDLEVIQSLSRATVLLLGVGGEHGSSYKLDILRRIRGAVRQLVVVEEDGHWAADATLKEAGATRVIAVNLSAKLEDLASDILGRLSNLQITVDAVLTYRQEWVLLRSKLASSLKLEGPRREAIETALSKSATRQAMRAAHLNVAEYSVLRYKEIIAGDFFPKFPLFIRPDNGIRSEWARSIRGQIDFTRYAKDISESRAFRDEDRFILEPILSAHEVDVDLFLYRGEVLYSAISDNLPTADPYALETGHVMPSLLSQVNSQSIQSFAAASCAAIGLVDGNVHAELMVDQSGRIFTLEINPRLGGMYIADWHREIWGVELILAELVYSLGLNPQMMLNRTDVASCGKAQLCIRSTSLLETSHSRVVEIPPSTVKALSEIDCCMFEAWYEHPQKEDLVVSGPLNLGALTCTAGSSEEAFKRLTEACQCHPEVLVDGQSTPADLKPLYRFLQRGPEPRYSVLTRSDIGVGEVAHLMDILSPPGSDDPLEPLSNLDPSCKIICLYDAFQCQTRPIGLISIHIWRRMRRGHSKSAYLHDLIVMNEYRSLGLAHMLFEAAVKYCDTNLCYKCYLDCEDWLIPMYRGYGFNRIGSCLVRYSK